MEVVAEAGSLSPYTSTSFTWDSQWPIKPEIVLEGGNALQDELMVYNEEDLSVLTTEAEFQKDGYFRGFHGTSPAAAYASWMAAKIFAAHPEMWPETVRGLMVHSAEWTPEMKSKFLHEEKKGHYARMARICGYGVPSLERALGWPTNSLALIAQASLQPFGLPVDGSRKVTKDMHVYELPWPKDELLRIGEVTVQMRVALSYFVEPSPGEIGWKNRYRYASHGLRFELNTPGEPREIFEKRVNRKKLGEDEKKPKGSASDYWTLGTNARDTGSIHSDIWVGSAADLADSNLLGIYPVGGWWKDRAHLGRWNRQARYSLIVSITTPEMEIEPPINIYTPVAKQIGIDVPVPIQI